jgi:hypothetical protein
MDALKRVDAGIKVPYMCRELGISSTLFYRWRAKFCGMDNQPKCCTENDVIADWLIHLTGNRRSWGLVCASCICVT